MPDYTDRELLEQILAEARASASKSHEADEERTQRLLEAHQSAVRYEKSVRAFRIAAVGLASAFPTLVIAVIALFVNRDASTLSVAVLALNVLAVSLWLMRPPARALMSKPANRRPGDTKDSPYGSLDELSVRGNVRIIGQEVQKVNIPTSQNVAEHRSQEDTDKESE